MIGCYRIILVLWLTLVFLTLDWVALESGTVCDTGNQVYCTGPDELDLPSIKMSGVPVSTGASSASTVSFLPGGTLVATTVQAAIEELDADTIKDPPTLQSAFDNATSGEIMGATPSKPFCLVNPLNSAQKACWQWNPSLGFEHVLPDGERVQQLNANSPFRLRNNVGALLFEVANTGAVSGAFSGLESIIFAGGPSGLACTVPGTTTFIAISSRNSAGLEVDVQYPIPRVTTFSKMYVHLSAAVPASETVTFTLRKNTTDTALQVSVGAGNLTGNNTAESATFAVGDLAAIEVTCSGGTATLGVIKIGMLAK